MTAEIQEKTRTLKYFEVRCPDCDDMYIYEDRTLRAAQNAQELHDIFVHSDPPKQHYIRYSSFRGILGGDSITCVCGYRTNTDNHGAWKCPLDRSES